MAVAIPSFPAGSTTTITLKTSAVDQTPYLGGPVQRVARLGDRWSYSVELRPMQSAQARPLVTAIRSGLTQKVLCPVVISGIDTAGQTDLSAVTGSGKSMTVTGNTTEKVVGQMFSLVANGVRYLHELTGVAGQTIYFNPALKVVINGGEPLEFVTPKIEGFIDGVDHAISVSMVGASGLSLKINEAA